MDNARCEPIYSSNPKLSFGHPISPSSSACWNRHLPPQTRPRRRMRQKVSWNPKRCYSSSALEWLFPHLLWASLSQTHLPVRLARWGLIEIWTLTDQVPQIIGHHYIRGKSPQSTKFEHAKTSEYHGGNSLMTSPGWVPKMPGHELRTSGGAIQNDERWNSSDLTVTGGRFGGLNPKIPGRIHPIDVLAVMCNKYPKEPPYLSFLFLYSKKSTESIMDSLNPEPKAPGRSSPTSLSAVIQRAKPWRTDSTHTIRSRFRLLLCMLHMTGTVIHVSGTPSLQILFETILHSGSIGMHPSQRLRSFENP